MANTFHTALVPYEDGEIWFHLDVVVDKVKITYCWARWDHRDGVIAPGEEVVGSATWNRFDGVTELEITDEVRLALDSALTRHNVASLEELFHKALLWKQNDIEERKLPRPEEPDALPF